MTIPVTPAIHLALLEEKHASLIFNLVENNRLHLRPWLSFVDNMQSVDFALNFVKGTIERNATGQEWAFLIMLENEPVGRIGVYNIDGQNKVGEIGYWLSKNAAGKGIITQSCKALIHFCFNELLLNRIEIKCATENESSNAIPQKLKFTYEGIIRQGEFLHGAFNDLNLYSLLITEYE